MKHQFEFLTITLEEFLQRKNILEEIRNNQPAGIIIKNFFSESECSVLKEKYSQQTSNKSQLPLNQGYTYPTVFAHQLRNTGGDPEKAAAYFQFCSEYKNTFEEIFGVNAPKRFQELFENGGGGRTVAVMPSPDFKHIYPACSFRDLATGVGEMTLHCGLFFYDLVPHIYEHVLKVVEKGDQLSFFTVLQKAETGGELTIFDVSWDEAEKRVNDLELEAKNGSKLQIGKDIDSFPVDIAVGDLLIFNGGRIWHRIEIVGGQFNRLTLGGFIGFSENKKEIYFWS